MKPLEPELSDELHAKVTTVLVELTRLQRHAAAARAPAPSAPALAFGKG